jgi:hypothetical protein
MRLKMVGALILFIAAAPNALANIFIASASKDTTLFEDAAGGLAGGKSLSFFVGRIGPNGGNLLRRGAIAFDLSSIPTNALITDVTLNLMLIRGNGGPQPIDLHRFTNNWGEGASVSGPQGIPAEVGDATWKFNFFNTSSWNTIGGDFSPTVSATQMADFAGPLTWGSTPQMVADVQGWVSNPATNFGWALTGNEITVMTAKEFDSRENSTNQPALTVTFSVPEPASCVLLGVFGISLAAGRRRPR